MSFTPTHARYQTLLGLQLKDGDGPWMSADTKNVFLAAGCVYLVDSTGQFDERVTVPATDGHNEVTFIGTRNAVAVDLARRRNLGEFNSPADGSWLDIPIPVVRD